MSQERHEKSEKKTATFVASLHWRTAAIERTTGDLSCLSAIRDNLLLCLWPSKRKPRHCGESTGKSDQDSVTKYHQFRSVAIVVDSNPAAVQLLISRECFLGEAEREWWEAEVTGALRCVLWETKHPSARSPQWKSEPSNSFSPQQCKLWSWNCAFWQGSRISREFHCFAEVSSPSWWCCSAEEFSLQYLLERKTSQASFTQDPEWVDWLLKKSLVALASAGGCKSSIRKKYNLFASLASTLPHSFHASVSLLSEILPTNLSNSAKNSVLSVSCAPSTDVSGYAPVWLWQSYQRNKLLLLSTKHQEGMTGRKKSNQRQNYTRMLKLPDQCEGADGGAVANRSRRRTSDQTVLGSNPAVAAVLSPWTRLFTPIVPRRSLHISFY